MLVIKAQISYEGGIYGKKYKAFIELSKGLKYDKLGTHLRRQLLSRTKTTLLWVRRKRKADVFLHFVSHSTFGEDDLQNCR